MINRNYEKPFNLDNERKRANIDKKKLQKYIDNPPKGMVIDQNGSIYSTAPNLNGNLFGIIKQPGPSIYYGGYKEETDRYGEKKATLEGYGILKNAREGINNYYCEGYFKNNKLGGYGKLRLKNDVLFEGNFVDGLLDGRCKVHIGGKELDIVCDKGHIITPQNLNTSQNKILYYSADLLKTESHIISPHNIIDVKEGRLRTFLYKNQRIDYSGAKNTIVLNAHGNTVNVLEPNGQKTKKSALAITDNSVKTTENVIDHVLAPLIQKGTKLPGELDIIMNCCLQYELLNPAFREKITNMLNNNSKIFGNNVRIYFSKDVVMMNFEANDKFLSCGDYSHRLDFIKQKDGKFESSIRRNYTAKVLEEAAIRTDPNNVVTTRF